GFAIETGATVALIEKHRVGGDCTWTGCVPSKSLLKAAKVAHHMRTAGQFGIQPVDPDVDMRSVTGYVQGIVAETYKEETPDVLRERGSDVYLGEAHFLDPHTLQVGDDVIQARDVVIATGAHPFTPPIKGIETVDYLTYETVFQLETLPKRLIVVGGGPIGSEMTQAFQRLGAQVIQVETVGRILSRDDEIASRIMMDVFKKEGVDIRCHTRAQEVWQAEDGIHLRIDNGDEIIGDALLMAVGRRPNVEGLDLEKAGVAYSPKGIEVDRFLRTSQPHIYAAGDCTGSFQFTHYAGWQAAMAARNALLPARAKGVREWVPWTTFTDPEVAHAGLTEAQARETYGDAVATLTWSMEKVDRARAESDTAGVVHLVHKGGRVLGVTIVSERAGELIHEWMHVLEGRLKVRDVTTSIHIYPSYSRANVKAGGALLQKVLLTGKIGRVVGQASQLALKFMRWQRGL
ncbi:MAG: FAD-dependent oxidoreductase, partial [Anaerolineae bacterium]|nr:FAD-dependent oxidoreductase [Anaerolineae bacterium]